MQNPTGRLNLPGLGLQPGSGSACTLVLPDGRQASAIASKAKRLFRAALSKNDVPPRSFLLRSFAPRNGSVATLDSYR